MCLFVFFELAQKFPICFAIEKVSFEKKETKKGRTFFFFSLLYLRNRGHLSRAAPRR